MEFSACLAKGTVFELSKATIKAELDGELFVGRELQRVGSVNSMLDPTWAPGKQWRQD